MYPYDDVDPSLGEDIRQRHIVVLQHGCSSGQLTDHLHNVLQDHNRASTGAGYSPDGLSCQFSCGTFKAYCGEFLPETIRYIEARPEVAFVEKNQLTTTDSIISQSNIPSWGLARISQRVPDNLATYFYDKSSAEGVTAYVLDSGIRISHEEFENRATWGHNTFDTSDNTVNDDMNGHGTHVAGTLGGVTYGVAKKVSMVAVKIIGKDGTGTTELALRGIHWAFNDACSKGVTKCVVNMSVGSEKSDAIDLAVAAAVAGGLTFVVSAGNKNIDAASRSPASAPGAITVGSVGSNNARASNSNYGASVNIFAPGIDITSAWNTGDMDEQTKSGTSMATPHVAGIVAFLLAEGITDIPAAITKLSKGGVNDPGPETIDLLIYNGSGH